MSEIELLNILIVDDNKNNLLSLRSLIEEYVNNVWVFEADSGIAALNVVMKEKIHLILLDIQMPDMDGFETAQMIRSWQKMQHIPIVFLTAAYKSKEFEARGFAIGAADYLTKPIDTSQLIARINSYVRFIQQERQHKQELERQIKKRTTELLKANYQLREAIKSTEHARAAAELANQVKSQFLANMSHELRTPLNAIIGYSEMMEEELTELEQYTFVEDLKKIQGAGKHLLGLINGVLDLSKIEAGKMELFPETFILDSFIDEVVNTVLPLVEKNANVLQVKYPPQLGSIHTDITKLRQMLLNLLSNATKFTQEGFIYFTINTSYEKGNNFIVFSIKDNGIGMTEKQLNALFQPFTQADASTTRRFGGTGLGLTITKQLAEMMGGHITVESEFGKGSTFTLFIPAVVAAVSIKSETEVINSFEGRGVILVVDDDVNIRDLLKKDLTKLGYAVATAVDGDEGIKLANKLRPDAILLDIQMPSMDGWRVLSMLKSDSLLSRIPVIMISVEEHENKGLALGALDYITKPIERYKLAEILNKHHISHATDGIVMCVDDDAINRELITQFLESEDLHVFQAENGKVALEQLEIKKPSLILLDLNMPVMNGFEFLMRLRENEKWREIPVVVVTAQHLTPDEYTHLNQYVNTILNKETLRKDDFVIHVHQLLTAATQ